MEQLLKLQQISSISNGIFEPSAIKLDAKDCKITGSILSIEQVGDFQILNSLALVEDEIIMAEVVYPGFMRLQALEGYYLPSWPVPDCLKEFMVNLEVTICSNQSCIIQDRCLSDSFVAVQNIARQVDISLFYFDFCLEYLFWQDCIKLGKPIGNSPFKKFIKLLGICKPSVAILDGLEVFSNEWKDYDQISVKDFQYYVLSILQAAKGPSLEVCLIGICKDIKLLDPIFVSWFRRRLYLKAPNSIQLKAYLESLGNQSHGTSEMAMNTIGQSYSELYRNNLNTRNDCEDISDEFKNLDLNGGLQNLANYRNTYLSSAIETKDVRIDPVFGYKDLQDKLKRFITLPLLHPGTFTRLGIKIS